MRSEKDKVNFYACAKIKPFGLPLEMCQKERKVKVILAHAQKPSPKVVNTRCHELPKSPGITEITKKLTEITKKLTEITTKRTEITGTSSRYMFTELKNVTFITVSNMLMISSKKMWKNTKKPEVAILFLLDAEL